MVSRRRPAAYGQPSDPAFRQTLKEEYAAFWTAYQQDRDLLRFHYHRPREIWENLKDLDLPRRTFSSDLSQVPTVQHFITEDEIDTAMTGGSSLPEEKAVSMRSSWQTIRIRRK